MAERIVDLPKDLPVLNRALREIERLGRELADVQKTLQGLQKQINDM